jgi:hypothetical protein
VCQSESVDNAKPNCSQIVLIHNRKFVLSPANLESFESFKREIRDHVALSPSGQFLVVARPIVFGKPNHERKVMPRGRSADRHDGDDLTAMWQARRDDDYRPLLCHLRFFEAREVANKDLTCPWEKLNGHNL